MTTLVRLTVIAALVFMALRPAQAQQVRQYTNGLPPIEYDKPYTGELTIIRFTTEADVLATCTVSKSRFACAKTPDEAVPSHCVVVMLIDEKLKAYGDNYPALTMRHELGHCNGWDVDHKGERGPIFTDTHIEMPKLPASTKELPAYPPVVCITPAGKQESCNNRKN
jgi:hypothetical protein